MVGPVEAETGLVTSALPGRESAPVSETASVAPWEQVCRPASSAAAFAVTGGQAVVVAVEAGFAAAGLVAAAH